MILSEAYLAIFNPKARSHSMMWLLRLGGCTNLAASYLTREILQENFNRILLNWWEYSPNTLKQTCWQASAICVQRSNVSRNSAIRIAYRSSLRSSSVWEPRYPSLRIFFNFKESMMNMIKNIKKQSWWRNHLANVYATLRRYPYPPKVAVVRLKVDNDLQSEIYHQNINWVVNWIMHKACVNDPSAGSPTETLLRLLLPLSDKVYLTSCSTRGICSPESSPDHSKSVGATGGVYKGQGRIQHRLMTCAYKEFLVQDL